MCAVILFLMAFVMQLLNAMLACAILSFCGVVGALGYIVIDAIEFYHEIQD